MIPLERLRELEQGRACDVNSPDYFTAAGELLRIREMAAEIPHVHPNGHARSILMARGEKGLEASLTCALDSYWHAAVVHHAARLAEAQEEYRAAVQENVALIATGAELNEECARLREFAQHGSNCEFGWRGSKCECGLLDILSRGGAK